MRTIKKSLFLVYVWMIAQALSAQQFNSVPLDSQAYDVLENAILRGLIDAPPSAKPWSEYTVRQKLNELLDSSGAALSPRERDVVVFLLRDFERAEGFNLRRGGYGTANKGENGFHSSFNAGLSWESGFSADVLEPAFGTTNVLDLYMSGDLSNHLSYDFHLSPGFYYVDRRILPQSVPAQDPKTDMELFYPGNIYAIDSYFPYTFSRLWDGVVSTMDGFAVWPNEFSFGYELTSEINVSFISNRLNFRFGRIRRDWGAEENGASLALNAAARPFLAVEGTAVLTNWLYFSFLTGILEYEPAEEGMKDDARSWQNAFSLALLESNIGRYVHIDFGSSVIWPKRFELGYLFPANSNLIYQNSIGDFDNIAIFGDLSVQFPGKFRLWFTAYLDEAVLRKPFLNLKRNRYALQGGLKVNIPWLPFASFDVRYTKIEPFTNTHAPQQVPWYYQDDSDDYRMDTYYANNGEAIGYYLSPNSDEFLLGMRMLPLAGLETHLQYQLIRHGVDYGQERYAGSSLKDFLSYHTDIEPLRKDFLRDGVYQWTHVLKIGGAYNLKVSNIPVSFFAETGLVITRFTKGGTGVNPKDYESLDTAEYPADLGFILSAGFKIYP
jgi:hypothetical protein